MNKTFVLGGALALAFIGGPARAQAPAATPSKEAAAPKRPPAPASKPGVTPASDKGESPAEGHDKHGGKGMGHHGGMMGGGMEDGCPMMAAHDSTMKVTNTPNGVTIALTAQTPEAVAKLQKMAEKMRAKHEAHGK